MSSYVYAPQTLVCTQHTPNPELYTLVCKNHTPNPELYTLVYTNRTPNPELYTPGSELQNLKSPCGRLLMGELPLFRGYSNKVQWCHP